MRRDIAMGYIGDIQDMAKRLNKSLLPKSPDKTPLNSLEILGLCHQLAVLQEYCHDVFRYLVSNPDNEGLTVHTPNWEKGGK